MKIVIIVGPSGCGKTAIAKVLCSKYSTYFERVVTDTSRAPRGGEKEGVDYNFVSAEDFSKPGYYIEHACYSGNWYGTRKDAIDTIINKNRIPILIMDIQGADAMRSIYGDKAIAIFIDRNLEESAEAVDKRKCSAEEKSRRKAQLKADYAAKEKCDFVVKNNKTLEDAAAKIVMHAFS